MAEAPAWTDLMTASDPSNRLDLVAQRPSPDAYVFDCKIVLTTTPSPVPDPSDKAIPDPLDATQSLCRRLYRLLGAIR